MNERVEQVLYSWNRAPGPAWHSLEIEDDTFRDGLQGAFVRRPSFEETCELLRATAALGIQHTMLGFPAASPAELDRCRALIRVIENEGLPVAPRFLARTRVDDLAPIVAIQDGFSTRVEADCF